jgi:nitronate monooxygenase
LVSQDERATNLIFRKLKNTARVAKNSVSDRVVAILNEPNAIFADVAHLVSGRLGRDLLNSGDLDAGIYWAGQVQGLIHDVPSVSELITRIVHEATGLIETRLRAVIA